ncbi:DUF4382 domain-containing protein [Prevotella sp.]|uniref:DUF4382 domain-containing protein n=1 Tax=Prevotella sp. TaxID=59823 RepID=UPI002649FB94|nr:DUF4382 domain-containing protein [Prevotella sp.]MDN5554249.1 DUF4382 domain-containing protein [Prevotella sp.]
MMKQKLFFLCLLLIGLYSCSNNDNNSDKESKATVGFYLTDAPSLEGYKSVNIDIQSIECSLDGQSWTTLDIKPCTVDLLHFSNGKDSLLSNVEFSAGTKVQQIRLVLGDNNTVVLNNGTTVSLKTPSGQTSGLKLDVQSVAQLTSGYKIIIDFDASRSIVKQGNSGSYLLKPVIRSYITANTSAIDGNLQPSKTAMRIFTVASTNDTISTLSDTIQNNYFKLHGLFSGTYDLKAEDLSTKNITVIKSGIQIVGGTDVHLGNLTLKK